ncbi:hypothetical protein P9875_25100 [Janthinobacterium rivuli]|uniref:Uncharacterized protein n=1 Tax=Janthinobacterium rivuli TaxID=2751478 RepID=A0ABY8I376_9BURK|nr:hypothetical protein [Janthinobacterium rivuli]WFR78939.1 hypothetical protein P9875_25100 [Janthinobacterium rivuli]
MHIEPPHASLGQPHQLELDEANSEREADALYQLDLLNQVQRDAALEVRVREHGSELTRDIMEASRLRHGHDHIPYQRPPAWKGALIVLGLILVMSVVYGWFSGGLQP